MPFRALSLLLLLSLWGCPRAEPRGGVSAPGGVARGAAAPALELELIPPRLLAGPLFTLRGEYAQLFFHLNLYNRSAAPLRLRTVTLDLLRQGQRLRSVTYSPRALAQDLRPTTWIVMRDRQSIAAAHRWRGDFSRPLGRATLGPGAGVSLPQLFILLRPAQLPDALRITARHAGGQATLHVAVEVYRQRTVLRLPVQGPWWVMAGHRYDEYHGQALIHSQNFAYDLGRLGPALATFSGDGRENAAYLCHDQPVLAAADGEVVELQDGVAENTPAGLRPALESVLRQPRLMAGNFVVLRHAAGEYTAYMHLRPGLPLREGQRVEAGELIGRCGNSGNSSEPHLHFQLQDGPDPFRAHGLPARFADFSIDLGRQQLYVPAADAAPLPLRRVIRPGKAAGAVPLPGGLLNP